MAKKQIDLFGKEISLSKTKEIEKTLDNKLEGDVGKVLTYLKKDGNILALVKGKKHRTLQKYANTLSPIDFKKVRQIMKSLEDIYKEEKCENCKFEYFENVASMGTKNIFHNIVNGLRPLYNRIITYSDDLELYHAFFEMLVDLNETTNSHIGRIIEDLLDHYGGSVLDFDPQELYAATVDYLKASSVDYEENPEVKISVSFNGFVYPSFDITKFYHIKY